jgi:hypothetical protein
VFGLFRSRAMATAAAGAVAGRGRSVLVTRTVDRSRYQAQALPRRV